MSLTRNTIANYLGQAYTTVIGIVILPFYLRYLGAEAYGLVGFFAVMQAWLLLLDMGLSPTLARQVSHVRGKGTGDFSELLRLLRSIEIIFLLLGVSITLATWIASPWIAEKWLNVKTLPLSEVGYCITLMGAMVGLRWLTSLYRSGIQGMELQVWLNASNAALASIRYLGVWGLLVWVTQEPRHFFEFQLLVSFIELAVIGYHFCRLLPSAVGWQFRISWVALKSVSSFTGGVAYTSALWILLTQLDKLILSHLLVLKEYGYFALVAVAANGILSLTGPISSAILPRMTLLLSQGKEAEMLALYRKATQLMAAIMFPLVGTVALFSNELIYAWTGDKAASDWAGPVLRWFALGNGILAIGAFQYYLQYAHGQLRLHVIVSTINTFLQIPIIVYVTYEYGALGAGIGWFVVRAVCFFFWSAIVHNHFAPGMHAKWLVEDILSVFVMTCISLTALCNTATLLSKTGRIEIVVILSFVGVISLFGNVLVAKTPRSFMFKLFKFKGV